MQRRYKEVRGHQATFIRASSGQSVVAHHGNFCITASFAKWGWKLDDMESSGNSRSRWESSSSSVGCLFFLRCVIDTVLNYANITHHDYIRWWLLATQTCSLQWKHFAVLYLYYGSWLLEWYSWDPRARIDGSYRWNKHGRMRSGPIWLLCPTLNMRIKIDATVCLGWWDDRRRCSITSSIILYAGSKSGVYDKGSNRFAAEDDLQILPHAYVHMLRMMMIRIQFSASLYMDDCERTNFWLIWCIEVVQQRWWRGTGVGDQICPRLA